VEGTLVANDLDVFASAGGSRSAYILETLQPCVDGAMSLELVAQLKNPMLAGVEIIFDSPYQLVLQSAENLYDALDNYMEGNLLIPINDWNVSLLTNFDEAFSVDRNPRMRFFSEDLDRWDVSSATSMWGIFRKAEAFDGNISTWSVERVRNFDFAFDRASNFTGDLSLWNPVQAETFYGMFRRASRFRGLGLSDWQTHNIGNTARMFLHASLFDPPGGLVWNTSKVTRMDGMVRTILQL